MNVNFYAQRFVGRALDVNNLPATVEGTGEATQISGRFVITDYTGGGDQVGIFYLMPEDAHNEFYAAMETDPNFADREFDFPMYTVGVADLFEQTTDDMWDEIEVQHLQSQFDLPSAEHPLGPHTGYKLDPDLDAVLREQMIEGGVPEEEVQPSIDDIEEAMDKRTGAKIEWGNQYERLSDRRLRGKLSKQPDGQWLIVVITDTTFGNGPNLRVPESGEEVIAPVRGEDHSFILLDRVYPELPGIDTSEPPHSNNYSYWTFKGAPAQERTAAKIEWNTPFERYSDPRLIGGFNKQDDGSWLIQVSINNRGGNTRFPEPGEEVIVPVKGEDNSFRVLERVYPKDESYRIDDDLYSWWTFEAVPDNMEENGNITNMEDNHFNPLEWNISFEQADFWIARFNQSDEAQAEFNTIVETAKENTMHMINQSGLMGQNKSEMASYDWFGYFLNQLTAAVRRDLLRDEMAMYANYKVLSDAPTYQKMVQDMVNQAFGNQNQAAPTANMEDNTVTSVEIERTTMPSEHLGWYEKTANELESSYYTVRLTGENVAIIKGALRVLANQIGGAEAAQIQNALEALETAEYDVSGSGLGDIPTLPEEPER